MGRHALRLVMVLGALVTLLGGTGIFAVFNDQAVGGVNSATSGSRLSAADLTIAAATLTSGNVVCGTFGENTETPQITASNLQPSSTSTAVGYACLRNVGSAALTITAAVIELQDIDIDCTGDEAESGDTSCGNNLQGDLSRWLVAQIEHVNCTGATQISGSANTLPNLVATPVSLGATPFQPGAPICIRLLLSYPSTTPESGVQLAQSDQVTWRFAFEGTAQ